ncbi:hypothetical protein COEREDRAFT_80272, partial [Coemansia reversa NRRL 1564]
MAKGKTLPAFWMTTATWSLSLAMCVSVQNPPAVAVIRNSKVNCQIKPSTGCTRDPPPLLHHPTCLAIIKNAWVSLILFSVLSRFLYKESFNSHMSFIVFKTSFDTQGVFNICTTIPNANSFTKKKPKSL